MLNKFSSVPHVLYMHI